MDEPITDVVVVTSTNDCPHGYTILKTTPCGHPANLWEKVFGGRSAERYICFTKTTGQNDTVVEDMIIPPPSQRYLRKGYRAISQTPDGDEPLRHKQLVLKRSKRAECTEAIVDVVVYRSKDEPARGFRKLAKVNDLYVCVRPAKLSPTASTTATEKEPVVTSTHVQENVQVNLEPVVESSPNMDAVLDKMDQVKISTTANTYPQTVAAQSIPEATSTYSSSQTTPGSYSMPEGSNYASGGTQGTTYPASTYSSSQTTTSSYSMPESNTYPSNTQGATTYPASTYLSSSYSNSSAPYSSSNTGYSNPSDPYSGTTYPSSSNTQYPNNQYSNTAYSAPAVCQSSTSYSSSSYTSSSGQYSSNPYSNSSYSSQTNPYANAGYSTAGYSSAGYSNASYGSGSSSLPYSANPTAGAYSTQQYPPPTGYSTQPPPSTYPAGYQSGGYPSAPPTNQGYGSYPPTGGSYGNNQPGYPPTTQHFSGDIGFGF